MMNSQLFKIRQRRSEILARIASQRNEVVKLVTVWQTPLAMADQGLTVARFLCSHLALTATIVTLVTVRRRGVIGLGKIMWRGWRLYRLAKSLWLNLA